jgi:hypothetical protein
MPQTPWREALHDFGNTNGLTMTGKGSLVAGSVSLVAGGYTAAGNGNIFNNEGQAVTPIYNSATTQDPYAHATPPSAQTQWTPSGFTNTPRPNQGSVSLSGQNNVTLSPGVYSMIDSTGQGNITLQPGVYIITGGSGGKGLNLTGQGNVTVDPTVPSPETGTGVLFYLTGGTVNLTGNGSVFNLPAPNVTSSPWYNMSIWVDKNNSDANDTGNNGNINGNKGVNITGNGNMSIGGVIYGSTTHAVLTGNGDGMGLRLVVDLVDITGNGNVKVGFNGTPPPVEKQLGLVQ